MKFRLLGKTPLMISEIGYGCMSLKQDTPAERFLLQAAFDRGINYFDTADIYGHGVNEVLLGKALKQQRQHAVIATKVGNYWNADGTTLSWIPTGKYILEAVEQSLRRLQTDYIDLYHLHGGTLEDPMDDVLESFELLRQQGKIRYYGISSIRPNVIREYIKRSSIVSVMMQYSLLDRRPEASCFSLLEEQGFAVLARGALAQGLLINKPPKDYLGHAAEVVERAQKAVLEISSMRDPAQTALQFALSQPVVRSAIVGIGSKEQLETALQAGSAPALTEKEIAFLREQVPANFYEQHL